MSSDPTRTIHPQQRWTVAINVLGGIAVLGSYAQGLATNPAMGDALWGGVPEGLRQFYTVSMLLAAAGYFPFTYFLVFRIAAGDARIAGRLGYATFNLLYLLILVPSALWMPLTVQITRQWDPALWLTIRVVLGLVAVGSLGLLASLLALIPRPSGPTYWLAIAGAVAFCVQTVALDACVWPAFFPTPP